MLRLYKDQCLNYQSPYAHILDKSFVRTPHSQTQSNFIAEQYHQVVSAGKSFQNIIEVANIKAATSSFRQILSNKGKNASYGAFFPLFNFIGFNIIT